MSGGWLYGGGCHGVDVTLETAFGVDALVGRQTDQWLRRSTCLPPASFRILNASRHDKLHLRFVDALAGDCAGESWIHDHRDTH